MTEIPSTRLLRPLQHWLDDKHVSEIMINRPKEIWVEKNGKMTKQDIPILTDHHLETLFRLIANENHQTLSRQQPLLSGSLFDGSRVQLVIPPITLHRTLAIRRKVAQRLTLQDYAEQQVYNKTKPVYAMPLSHTTQLPESEQSLFMAYQQQDWPTFLEEAIKLKKTIVISGGTSSGKTTFLNACLQAIEPGTRLLILEDTREVEAPHANQVALLATKGDQGEARVTMQDLVQCCLRLRPDRIIVGEIRGKEILDFLAASATGHDGSMTSIHASSPQVAWMRMTQLYKLNNVPSMTDDDILRELKTVIHIIIQLEKTPQGRKVQSIYYQYGHLSLNQSTSTQGINQGMATYA